MSGGIDSSVTAYLLSEAGYEVIGVTMDLPKSDFQIDNSWSYCPERSSEDTMKIAESLGIPHHTINLRRDFKEKVIDHFLEEYQQGRTPNPCIICNREIKFGLLLNEAKELGIDVIATGHYAKIEKRGDRYFLKRAKDLSKDQSYFLSFLSQEQLSHSLFPLGEYQKEEVREIAYSLRFGVAEGKGSQEVCFIPDDDYRRFLREQVKERMKPGYILDREGKILGKHQGIAFYTIGQRRGLGLARGKPLYVIRINPKDDTLVVGEEEELYQDELVVKDVNWVSIEQLTSECKAWVKIRYLHKESEALIYPVDEGRVRVKLKRPQRAITPGQAAVFYQDDMVLGGGWIEG